MSYRSGWRGRVAALAIAWFSGTASAQSESEPVATVSPKLEQEARQFFKDGNAFFDAGLYEAALSEFQAAYAAWPNPKIVLNIATTLRALGRNAEALQAYLRYSSEARPNAERQAEVDAICNELLGRVATVRFTLDPGVQSVVLDGNRLEAESRGPLYMEPGAHRLVIVGADGEQQTLEFDVQPGEMRELAPTSPAKAIDPVSDTPPPSPPEPSSPRRHLSLWARADIDGLGRGLLGAGGLGLTLGTRWQVATGALLGARRGAWVGLEHFMLTGSLQPSLGLSAPVFFSDAAHVGISVDAGARWAMGAGLFWRGRAAVVHFPSVPEGYSKTVFVPSLGLEWQL